MNEYEVSKLVLQRQLRKYTRPHIQNQQLIYQAVIDTFLSTIGTKFGHDATSDILNAAMTTCPDAITQLNRSKTLIKDD